MMFELGEVSMYFFSSLSFMTYRTLVLFNGNVILVFQKEKKNYRKRPGIAVNIMTSEVNIGR